MGDLVASCALESPIGTLQLAATPKGLLRITLPRSGGIGFRGWLKRMLPDAEPIEQLPQLDLACQEIREYFAGRLRVFTVPLDLRGTDFQCEVWRALVEIPYGETRSYADVARQVRRPKAFRGVGNANGANPIPLLVPCHRVVTSRGKLGGYGGGLQTKRRLLALEQASPLRGALV